MTEDSKIFVTEADFNAFEKRLRKRFIIRDMIDIIFLIGLATIMLLLKSTVSVPPSSSIIHTIECVESPQGHPADDQWESTIEDKRYFCRKIK